MKLEVKKTPGGLFYAVFADGREVPQTREDRKWRARETMEAMKRIVRK